MMPIITLTRGIEDPVLTKGDPAEEDENLSGRGIRSCFAKWEFKEIILNKISKY